jgi:hypothetical protein
VTCGAIRSLDHHPPAHARRGAGSRIKLAALNNAQLHSVSHFHIMKKSILMGATLGLAGLTFASADAQAQTSSTTTSTSSNTGYIQSSKIIGSRIRGADGAEVGVIKDVVLDRQTGCMAYTVLETSGDSGSTWPVQPAVDHAARRPPPHPAARSRCLTRHSRRRAIRPFTPPRSSASASTARPFMITTVWKNTAALSTSVASILTTACSQRPGSTSTSAAAADAAA